MLVVTPVLWQNVYYCIYTCFMNCYQIQFLISVQVSFILQDFNIILKLKIFAYLYTETTNQNKLHVLSDASLKNNSSYRKYVIWWQQTAHSRCGTIVCVF